ncbi:MAG: glutathione S-transferase family protein [Methyloligellaceae bacterium]
MLKVYGRKSAFHVQKAMWFVGELGIAHELVEVGGPAGGLDAPDFRKMNPHGRIPVLDDGGTIVWESHTILRYLAARHGARKYWSDDPAKRTMAERWMDWAQTALQPDFVRGVFWAFYRTPEDRRDMAAVQRKVAQCGNHFKLLDGILEGRNYLLGDELSLADIPAGTNLYRYFNIDIDRPHVPNVERWFSALQERPAFREHVMVPFDELFGRPAD